MDVRITNSQSYLSAGRTVTLECESTGSRPPAIITWWKDTEKVITDNEVISDNGNLTLSTLSFVPEPEDHGADFSCTAENPSLPNSLIKDSRVVTVHCKYTFNEFLKLSFTFFYIYYTRVTWNNFSGLASCFSTGYILVQVVYI